MPTFWFLRSPLNAVGRQHGLDKQNKRAPPPVCMQRKAPVAAELAPLRAAKRAAGERDAEREVGAALRERKDELDDLGVALTRKRKEVAELDAAVRAEEGKGDLQQFGLKGLGFRVVMYLAQYQAMGCLLRA
eukprot:365022-Chlamydomonas_euryale.AAC.4